ncbi:hypothetical protein [Anaerosinus massiliensis]|uniref:hypothetical protein n=1 Tax=Massilibacillus massiliensis TaxID=1806837 RepID=UPI000DA60031|nr:hypothetical protein [Massilibacillus massiliensis]
MNVFESITDHLRDIHNETDLKNLEKIAKHYDLANLENHTIESELELNLSKEEMKMVRKLCDNCLTKEVVAERIYYNQGFSDAMRLIIHALVWKPVQK